MNTLIRNPTHMLIASQVELLIVAGTYGWVNPLTC